MTKPKTPETAEATAPADFSVEIKGSQAGFAIDKPDGDYVCTVEKAEFASARSSDENKLVKVMLRIDEGQSYANSCFFESFNVKHTNPVAARIGIERLSALVYATGLDTLDIPAGIPDLMNKKIVVRVWTSKSQSRGVDFARVA